MASFNYMNNTAPFWDFIASLEQQGSNHPFFGQNSHDRNTETETERGEGHEGQHGSRFEAARPPPFDPWSWGQQLFGGPGGLPHRGPPPHGPHGHHHYRSGPRGPSHPDEHERQHEQDNEKDGEKSDNDNDNDKEKDNGEGPSGSGSGSDGEGGRRCRRHSRCGGRRGRHGLGGRDGCGPHDGPGRGPRGFHQHHGPPPHHEGPHAHHGPHHHGGPGRRGPWGRGGRCGGRGPFGGAFGGPDFQHGFNRDAASMFAPLWEAFTAQHPSNKDNDDTAKDNEDFSPEADIFDTPSAYIIHISLPGAKKEDVGVNWDAEKSELAIAGVVYRPGDEELLKTLAMNERKVGPFERKIRLGTRANPAHVDADGITAKLEDGVLRVEVRKEDEGFVEIKKVDIE